METRMSVKRLPVEERPRERLYHNGPSELSLPELLAIVLGRGTKGASALALAYGLLERFGDIVALGRASLDDLIKRRGLASFVHVRSRRPSRSASDLPAFPVGREHRSGDRKILPECSWRK